MTRFEDVSKSEETLADWVADLFYNAITCHEDEDGNEVYEIMSNQGYEDANFWLRRLKAELPEGCFKYSDNS